jgi:high-affinity iron transporter
MLPTFVIGLREGLEAALIVGIIAAFLRKQGRKDLLRWVYLGVGSAIVLCLAVGIALDVLSKDLPQRQQEGLETVIGVFAVCMVTYMVVWMKRHSRELKGQLEELAADAIAGHSKAGRAMIAMAFLAVLREGFETVVFLLAAFNESGSSTTAAIGALIGILVAVALGYGIYRGGVRLNLSKFFRATGLVLVLVAAGLVVNALHTAHEAGWINFGQGRTVDLTALVRPGSVQSSLLTGMLGVQQHPVVIEVVGWLVYLIPVGLFVAWPPGRGPSRALQRRSLLGATAVAAVAAVVLALLLPARPAANPGGTFAGSTAQLVSRNGSRAVVRTALISPLAAQPVGAQQDLSLRRDGNGSLGGVAALVYTATVRGAGAQGRPARMSYQQLAKLNGGRLPIGLNTVGSGDFAAMSYIDTDTLRVWVEPRTGRVLDLRWSEQVTASVSAHIGTIPLGAPVATATSARDRAAVSAATAAARHDLAALDRRSALIATLWGVLVAGVLALLGAGALALREHRDRATAPVTDPTSELVTS